MFSALQAPCITQADWLLSKKKMVNSVTMKTSRHTKLKALLIVMVDTNDDRTNISDDVVWKESYYIRDA